VHGAAALRVVHPADIRAVAGAQPRQPVVRECAVCALLGLSVCLGADCAVQHKQKQLTVCGYHDDQYARWAFSDPRIVGFGTRFPMLCMCGCRYVVANTPSAQRELNSVFRCSDPWPLHSNPGLASKTSMALGLADMPETLAWYRALGQAIINRSQPTRRL
jgi:hypothetical protein